MDIIIFIKKRLHWKRSRALYVSPQRDRGFSRSSLCADLGNLAWVKQSASIGEEFFENFLDLGSITVWPTVFVAGKAP